MVCTICDGPFDIDQEGGRNGYIGILPVSFCVTCFAGIMDFAEQEMAFYDEDYLLEVAEMWGIINGR